MDYTAPSKCFLCGKPTQTPSLVSMRWVCFDCFEQTKYETDAAVAAMEVTKRTGFAK